jgi:hypothetical protein
MNFAFQFEIDKVLHTTVYTAENQQRLFDTFNSGISETVLYHEIQKGPSKGTVTKHLISITHREVTNLANGAVHRLVLV